MINKSFARLVLVLLSSFLLTSLKAQEILDSSSTDNQYLNLKIKVQFASIEKAKELLTTEDQFTKSWSQFDIDSRLHKSNNTKDDLFKYISSQAIECTVDEKTKVNSILEAIDNNIIKYGFKIDFPSEIYFVKTTAQEEGGAGGYTRANYVVLKEGIISKPESELQRIIALTTVGIQTLKAAKANPVKSLKTE